MSNRDEQDVPTTYTGATTSMQSEITFDDAVPTRLHLTFNEQIRQHAFELCFNTYQKQTVNRRSDYLMSRP